LKNARKKNRLKGWHFASSATLICLVINIFVYSCGFDDTHQLVLRDYTMYLQQELWLIYVIMDEEATSKKRKKSRRGRRTTKRKNCHLSLENQINAFVKDALRTCSLLELVSSLLSSVL
jgi:hypothetical protein